MAKARSYREGWLTSLAIDALRCDAAELFLFRLGLKADKNGVYHVEPELLRAAVYPLQLPRRRVSEVIRYRDLCAKAGLLRTWTAPDGRPYVQITKWRQTTQNEMPVHPVPPRDPPEADEAAVPLSWSSTSEPKRKEEGEERLGVPSAPTEKPFLKPIKAPSETEAQWLARLMAEYPTANIPGELELARARQTKVGKKLERLWFEKHWLPKLSEVVTFNPSAKAPATEPEPEGWRSWLEENCPGSAYGKDGRDEGRPWSELPPEVRAMISNGMKQKDGA